MWAEHQLEADTRSRWGRYLHLYRLVWNEDLGHRDPPAHPTQGAPSLLCAGTTPSPLCGRGLQAPCVSGLELQSTKTAFCSLSISPVKKMTVRDLPQPLLDLSEERVPNKEAIRSQEPKGNMVMEKADSFPPVETLGLLGPGSSTETPEDWPSEEEIRRFWKLRQEIVENGRAGALGNQLLPVELPPNLRAALGSKGKLLPHPRPLFR